MGAERELLALTVAQLEQSDLHWIALKKCSAIMEIRLLKLSCDRLDGKGRAFFLAKSDEILRLFRGASHVLSFRECAMESLSKSRGPFRTIDSKVERRRGLPNPLGLASIQMPHVDASASTASGLSAYARPRLRSSRKEERPIGRRERVA